MAKENPNLSYNNIPNLDIDWESIDPSNNKPWSGASIERVIKSSIKDAQKQASESSQNKIGAQWFDPSSFTMYHFKNVEDKRKWEESGQTVDDRDPSYLIGEPTILSFAGTQNRIQFVNPAGTTTLYFTTNANEANITVGFESQEKGITDTEWKEVSEDFVVSVSVDRGAVGNYETFIADKQVLNGNTLTFDVRRYLATGSNRIKVTARGVDSGAVANLTYQVTLTSMYLSPSNFTWYTPFIEGKTYNLGGMNIGGNLEKTLFVKVTKEGYEKLYEVAIGTNIYTDTAYIFKGLEFPEAGTGVYNVDIWLEAGTLQSEHLSYNIICVKADEQFTAKVVSIGNPTKVVYNFSDNELFEYCVYNGGQSSASPHLRLSTIINTNPNVIVDEDLVDVATSTPLKYVASLEVESQEAEIQLEAYMQYGNEQQVVFPIDNSKAFPATSGAVFYLNPSTRSNAQENKLNVVNAINSAEYTAEWNGMAWTDGMDGWTTDESGRKCLRLPAFTNVNINYQPLSSVTAKTIEFVYKVKNASDYSDAIITICDDASKADFKGIKITPKNILVHSSQLNTQDSLQDYNAIDEEVLNVIVTIIPNYKTNYGNLCQIYCNGEKVRSFEYANSDSFATSANIIMGNDTADLFLYKMRVYNIGFEKNFAMKNYVNSLPDRVTREAMNAELNSCVNDSMQLDYDTCVKNGYNTMVIEMLNGKDIPSLANQEAGLLCNLQIKINNIIEGELDEEMEALLTGTEIKNEVIEGQGTTAMTYPRWNFRWKLSKAYGKRRITAKKNVASSMQSHKMGATRLYNYLYSEIIGKNEVGGKVAVLQYPVFGFKKSLIDGTTNQYIYTPIGLYTIGADKGDKHTFGYDNAQYENSIIHLEGADHTPKSVGFDYPYEATKFSSSAEAMGAINTDGTVIGAWEVGMAGKLENNVKADEEGVQEMLNAEWMPAYNVAYHNSPYVMGVSETIASINANVDEWRKGKTADGKSFTLFEIYNASDYALHYYDIQTKQYKPTGVNVLTDVGLTASAVSGMSLAEIDAKIIELRKARFVAEWGTYFHTDDAILHYTFCLIFGVTDNFKKNTYPYKFPFLANGGKWRWRVDDLDTLFDVINQGLATKQPDILVGDTDATGSIYVGDTSVLWTLIKETQGNEIKAMAHKIFSAMVSHPLAEGANTQAKLVGCIKYFFWNFAQNYFPASAYNVDVEWTYEDTWANKNSWKEVNPLSQALGGHFEAERDWVTMRMLFMSSYFNFGAFTHTGYNDASTGQMVYGGADAHTFEITPAVSINPTIIRGSTETITYGDRVKANETVPLTVSDASGDDTRVYVQGLDYIKDLGDLKDLKVSAKNPTLSVASKRLQSLKVGDADASKVPTSGTISNLSFGDCPSLMVIDAQNLGTLVGAVDLSLLPRLKEALFGGTNVKTIGLPSGSKIERFQIPDSLTALDMQNLKFLNEEGFEYGTLGNIEFFRIENCDKIDKFALLKSMYLADGSKLKNIRVVGFNYEGNANDVTMVANMAIDKDKDGNEHFYNGINQEGQIDEEMLPVIEGRLKVNGLIYEDDGKVLKQYYPNLTLEVTGGYYVKFADPEVQRICAENWGDGIGITNEQIEAVTDIGIKFKGNTTIESFNEFERFTGVEILGHTHYEIVYNSPFYQCVNLKSIKFPNNLKVIRANAFNGCNLDGLVINIPSLTMLGNNSFAETNIARVENLGSIESTGKTSGDADYNGAFRDCAKLIFARLPNTLNDTGISLFYRCVALEECVMPSSIKHIRACAFYGCSSLVKCNIPESLTSIDGKAFCNCTSLEIEDLSLPNLETLGQNAFYGVKIKKISNLGKITVLQKEQEAEQIFGNKSYLESIVLPNSLTTIKDNALYGYSNATCNLPQSITTLGQTCLRKMTKLAVDVDLPNLTACSAGVFSQSGITSIKDLGGITAIPTTGDYTRGFCYSCSNLEYVVLSNKIASIGNCAFQQCIKLKDVVLQATTPPQMGNRVFDSTPIASGTGFIYVPDESVTAYQEATNWSSYASRIKGISELPIDNAELYEEIKDYLGGEL